MIEYLQRHPDKLIDASIEHILISVTAVAIAFLLAYLAAAIMQKNNWIEKLISGLCDAVFAIPSLAMFAILLPYTGLGKSTAVIALILYNQFTLTKSIYSAFQNIPGELIEAARGMGMSRLQVYLQVKLPMALPGIFGGLKLAMISTITMASLAATIGGGGIGILLFNGLSMKNFYMVYWGILLTALLAMLSNFIFGFLENATREKARGMRGTSAAHQILRRKRRETVHRRKQYA